MNRLLTPLLGTLLALGASVAFAAQILPVSYGMRNGDGVASGGSFNYWDRFYNGAGATTVDGAPLSGGSGDLTDGIAAADLWIIVENGAGTGPYVGWRRSVGADPIVTFTFTGSPSIDEIAIHLDNSNVGGVLAFASLLIDGVAQSFIAPASGTHGWATISGLALTGGSHTVQFVHEATDSWIFVSEVRFSGNVNGHVPEPGSLALLVAGLFGVLAGRRRGC